jgi:hypothetical protein
MSTTMSTTASPPSMHSCASAARYKRRLSLACDADPLDTDWDLNQGRNVAHKASCECGGKILRCKRNGKAVHVRTGHMTRPFKRPPRLDEDSLAAVVPSPFRPLRVRVRRPSDPSDPSDDEGAADANDANDADVSDSNDSDATVELTSGPDVVTRFADTMSVPDSQDDVPDSLDPSDPEHYTQVCPRCGTGTKSVYVGETLGMEECRTCDDKTDDEVREHRVNNNLPEYPPRPVITREDWDRCKQCGTRSVYHHDLWHPVKFYGHEQQHVLDDCIECYLRRRGKNPPEAPSQESPRPAPPSPAKSNCRYLGCPGVCEETDAQDVGLTCPVCKRHQLVDDEPQEDIDTQPGED